MSQERPQRPQQEPIKYGDVFVIQGELAGQPVLPRDAAMMQTAENTLLSQIQKGGAASIMQSAAMQNEKAGLVKHNDMNKVAADQGVSIVETDLPGRRIITEAVGGQVVGQFSQSPPVSAQTPSSFVEQDGGDKHGGITLGEALEATALTAGKKPVDYGDAAAIQAAEMRATGRSTLVAGGVAAAAQSAATRNARATRDEEKINLGDVLTDVTLKIPADRPATRVDAEGVTAAEMRNDSTLTTHPTGVAAAVTAAARLNKMNEKL